MRIDCDYIQGVQMKCLLSPSGKTLFFLSFSFYLCYLGCQVVIAHVWNLMISERHCLLRGDTRAEIFLTEPGLATIETFPFSSRLRDVHWGALSWEHAGRVRGQIRCSGGRTGLERLWISPSIVGTDIKVLWWCRCCWSSHFLPCLDFLINPASPCDSLNPVIEVVQLNKVWFGPFDKFDVWVFCCGLQQVDEKMSLHDCVDLGFCDGLLEVDEEFLCLFSISLLHGQQLLLSISSKEGGCKHDLEISCKFSPTISVEVNRVVFKECIGKTHCQFFSHER